MPAIIFYLFFRKLQPRLGGREILEFFNEPPKYNYNFCYINCNRNYIINYVEKLFLGHSAEMLVNNIRYVIHKANQPCGTLLTSDKTILHTTDIENKISSFLTQTYPKNKYLTLVFNILTKNNLINPDLFFSDFQNLHIADFCAFINNRFGKKEKTDVNMLKFCKYLRIKSIKFPKVCVKNPVALQLLT